MTCAAERAVLMDDLILHEARETLTTLTRMATDLVLLIEATEKLTGRFDPAHHGYPKECTSGRIRLQAIHRSIDELNVEIAILEGQGTGLRLAGQDGEPVERELDGAGRESEFVGGEWRAPA